MSMRLDRVRRMTRHEGRWRAQDILHRAAERVLTRTGAARWKRTDIARVLTGSVLDDCRAHIARHDWPVVQETIAARIAARPTRFVLDPSSAAALRDEVLARWPSAAHEASARADRLIDGRFDLLGYRSVNVDRYRVDLDASAKREVINDFTVGVSGIYSYDSRPPEGASNDDWSALLTVGWMF